MVESNSLSILTVKIDSLRRSDKNSFQYFACEALARKVCSIKETGAEFIFKINIMGRSAGCGVYSTEVLKEICMSANGPNVQVSK